MPVPRPTALLLVLCGAQFVLVLDVAVTNVALASIQVDLGFRPDQLPWLVTAYTLIFGSLLIFFGRAGDLWGRRRLFLAGLALFSLASLLCGLAQSPGQLIGARAVQGLGAAAVSPAALALLTAAFAEGPARNRALGVWGAVSAGGAAAGMLLGGALTEYADWRWVFLVNVPVGVLILFSLPRLVTETTRSPSGALDLPGAVTVTGALVALVWGLSQVEIQGANSTAVLGAGAVAIALAGTFVVVEQRSPAPLVPFSLFRSRNVAAADLVTVLISAVVIGQSYFISLYLRQVLGYSPLATGLALVPITITVMAVATAVPRLVPRFGVRVVLIASGVLLATGMLLYARLPVAGTYLDVLPGSLLAAAGLGCGLVAATIAATSGIAPDRQGIASGLLNTAQQVGGAIGLAILATLAASRTADLTGATEPLTALNSGFRVAFTVAAGFAAAASVLALLLMPNRAATLAAANTEPGELRA